MKYGRRRRRKSSYNRRKSSEVLVLSDTEELQNNASNTKHEHTQNTDTQKEHEDEMKTHLKEMEAPKEDPIHAPDDEEYPVVVRNEDPINEETEAGVEGQDDCEILRNDESTVITVTPQIPKNVENTNTVDTDVNLGSMKENNNLNSPTTDNGIGQVGLNSRETTFQKLRKRIMMNKLQKSNSREHTNPIRPSLYRKYPKRKPNREKLHDGGHVVQPKDTIINDMVVQSEVATATLEPIQKQVENEDYQRYYLQPLNSYGSIPIQLAVKEEPPDEKLTMQMMNYEAIEQNRNNDLVKEDVPNIDYKGAKRNLEREFDDEISKKSTEEERIWLRALKEQGVKEVKRNENIAGISQQYQNEYYKFIEGKDFSKEAKEAHNFNNFKPTISMEKKLKTTDKISDVKTADKNVDLQTTAKEAFELTDFCSSLMARHPLYLQLCEEQGARGAPGGGQVVFVPKLVPYPPTAPQINTQGQGTCQYQGKQCQGQCQSQAAGLSQNLQSVRTAPVVQPKSQVPSAATVVVHPTGQAEQLNTPRSIMVPTYVNSTNNNATATKDVGTNSESSEQQSSHNSRRKQNAPKRRKPKEGLDEGGKVTEAELSSQNIQQPEIPQPPRPSIAPIAVPGMPVAAAPGKDVAYAYIAIPVSAFVPNQTTPAVDPQPFAVPQMSHVPSNTAPIGQTQVQNQALDYSARGKSTRKPGEMEPVKSQGHPKGQRPIAPVHPLPVNTVPVNPFRQNPRHVPDSRMNQLPLPSQRPGQGQGLQGPRDPYHRGYPVYSASSINHIQRDPLRGQSQQVMVPEDQGHPYLLQQHLQSAQGQRVQQYNLPSESGPTPRKIKLSHPSQSTTQFSHFACLQQKIPHTNQVEEIPNRAQIFRENTPATNRNVVTSTDGLRRELPHDQRSKYKELMYQHSEDLHGISAFKPMLLPVKNEYERGQLPVYTGQSSAQLNVTQTGSQFPSRSEHAQVPSTSFPTQESRHKNQSQFIDLTDDADDVEDVYSPGDDDVNLPENLTVPQHGIAQSHPVIPDDAQSIQEEQIRLMDNVSKLAELHNEVGVLLNESTHILDTLAPPNENDGTEGNEARKGKRKKGKTGRKLIKYDAKGRRIFKFHEYCPR